MADLSNNRKGKSGSLAFLAQAKSSTSISPIYGGTQGELQGGEASQVVRLAVD